MRHRLNHAFSQYDIVTIDVIWATMKGSANVCLPIAAGLILPYLLIGCSLSREPESYSSILERQTTNIPYRGKDGQEISIYTDLEDARSRAQYACVLSSEGPVFLLKDSDAPSGYKQVVSGLEEKPCIGYVSEALIEPIPGGSSLVSQKRRSYSTSCNPDSAKYVLTVNEFSSQFNSNRARVESRYKNVCIGLVGAPTEIDKVAGQYELTLSPFKLKEESTKYSYFSKDPKVVANFPRGDRSIESVSVKGPLVRVFGKFKGFNDAFGGLFVNFDVSMIDPSLAAELEESANAEKVQRRARMKSFNIDKYTKKRANARAALKTEIANPRGEGDQWVARKVRYLHLVDFALGMWKKYDGKSWLDPMRVSGDVLVPGFKSGLDEDIARAKEIAASVHSVPSSSKWKFTADDMALVQKYAGTASSASAAGVDVARRPSSCVASDPSDTYINLRETPNGRLVGPVNNGQKLVVVGDSVNDSKGRPWIKVSVPSKSMIGYAMKSLTSGC